MAQAKKERPQSIYFRHLTTSRLIRHKVAIKMFCYFVWIIWFGIILSYPVVNYKVSSLLTVDQKFESAFRFCSYLLNLISENHYISSKHCTFFRFLCIMLSIINQLIYCWFKNIFQCVRAILSVGHWTTMCSLNRELPL